jgi:hypothetical protein
MNSLMQQIKALEKDIARNDAIIKQQQTRLRTFFNKTPVLIAALTGSFISGYVFARHKTLPQLLRTSFVISLRIKRFYSKFIDNRLMLALFAQQKSNHHS